MTAPQQQQCKQYDYDNIATSIADYYHNNFNAREACTHAIENWRQIVDDYLLSYDGRQRKQIRT